jgi:hypothetical protein
METVMNGIEKHAEYYRAYLPHDRSLIPLTIGLATLAAFWLFLYLVSAVGPQPKSRLDQWAARPSAVVSRTVSPRPLREGLSGR